MAATARPYGGLADLRAMQNLTQRLWPCHWHIGDLAWQRTQHLDRDWPIVLWESGGETVAWAWQHPPGHLDFLTADPDLVDEILEWFAGTATAERLTVGIADDRPHLRAALERHGYAPADECVHHYLSRSLADLPDLPATPGYTIGPSTDSAKRVACHRAVWHPSRVTEESYRNVSSTWPFRPELDWVAVAPDGTYAAYCLIWLDDHNRVGELEPVGTHPDHRRRGLARAVCLGALHALKDVGAETAVVFPVDSPPGHPGAMTLYRDLGFTEYGRGMIYARSAG
ncbi:GNAT family N-acetyltransferase [Actinokineospora sp. UTMC 2448]|uniref:GNAT family N-acetyltransferase n=1 Tax=Actinokineospora sp. UTMC 2448 TaxID=2268449 RepID=UPI0021648014|nr:GNAT family N-acetyltransferase [Actinokineospora sp. UTMC 2448]UVS80115.1 putative acetyltransferase [Actinokineospora sp. UTMC 2448]